MYFIRCCFTGVKLGKTVKKTKKGFLSFLKALSAVILVAAAFSFQGCSTVNSDLQGQRDPKELYEKGMTAYLSERYEESERLFKALMENHPLHPLSVDAQLILGDIAYATEKYDDAGSYYTNFTALHPAHPRASYALFQKGMSHLKDVLTIDRDQTSSKKALFAFEDLMAAYPDSPYVPRAKEFTSFLKRRLADREFYVGQFYFKDKNYKGALARFRDILRNYPETGLNDAVLFYIAESYSKLGENGLARDTYNTLITNYPESPYTRDAKDRVHGG